VRLEDFEVLVGREDPVPVLVRRLERFLQHLPLLWGVPMLWFFAQNCKTIQDFDNFGHFLAKIAKLIKILRIFGQLFGKNILTNAISQFLHTFVIQLFL
jgi:hypothetical protein